MYMSGNPWSIFPFVCVCVCLCDCLQFHERGILSFGDRVMNSGVRALSDVTDPALFVFRYFGPVMNDNAQRRIISYLNNTPQMREAENFIRARTADMNFDARIIIIAEWRRLRFDCCDSVSFNCMHTYMCIHVHAIVRLIILWIAWKEYTLLDS